MSVRHECERGKFVRAREGRRPRWITGRELAEISQVTGDEERRG